MTQQENAAQVEGFRLSPQQRRMWVERQGDAGEWQRTVAAAVIEGEIEGDELRAAVARVVDRHEILRTRFLSSPESPFPLQVIGEPALGWSVKPAKAAAETEAARIEGALALARRRPLGLQDGPVLHASLTPLGATRNLLTIALPALVCDAAGGAELLRQIAAAHQGVPGTAGEVLQYADLAEWQNQLLESAEAAAGRTFWSEQRWLALPAAGVPGRRPPAGGFQPRVVPVPLAAAGERLPGAAAACGADVPAFLLACWQTLLWRLGGGSEFLVEVAYEGRRHEELAGAVGPFSRSLPFPCRFEPDLPVGALAERVAARRHELAEWQEYFPLDGADGSRAAVRFDALDLGRGDLLRDAGVRFRLERLCCHGERFLVALRSAGTAEAELHYDAAALERRGADLVAGRLACLVASAVADPRRPIRDLEILPEEEWRTILAFNPEQAGSAPAGCFHERFARWAAREPEWPAVVDARRRLSYGELDAAVNRLARHLRQLGAAPEGRVAICLERSAEMVIALLAVLKAGAAYVPIDASFPRRRMAAVVEQSGARILICNGGLAGALPGVAVVELDADAAAIDAQSDADPGVPVAPSSLAYVMFTSGSTGRPKGVAVAHGHLFRYLGAVLDRLELPDRASYAIVSTLAADLGHTALLPALATGSCLHVVSAEEAADPVLLEARFRAHPVDCLKIVPSHLAALLASPSPRGVLPRQRLVLGGEACPWALVERVAALAPEVVVLNHYGPTEATVGATTYRVQPRVRPDTGSVPVGRPLEHARAYVLDEVGRPVPIYVTGELHLGGGAVARGYVGDPCLTGERFVPDPWAGTPGARVYRTGDRARWLPSGDLEFAGRVDDQLKIRGFRVEPGEIEAVLRSHPAVAGAKVIGRDVAGETTLAGYVAVDPATAGPVHRLLRLRAEGRLRGLSLAELPVGLAIAHLSEEETRFLYREIFEERAYFRHGIGLPPGACVIDAGAHIGLFSVLASLASRGSRVLAFEPVPPVFRALRVNAELYGGIETFDYGLSRENRSAEMTHYPRLPLMSSLHADPAREREVVRALLAQEGAPQPPPNGARLEELLADRLAGETLTVSLRRLSDVLRELGLERVDLLKIDVQKSEREVLAGIDREDWPKVRQVVAEVHDSDGALGEVVELLAAESFEVAVAQEPRLAGTPLHVVYARRPGSEVAAPPRELPAGAASCPAALVRDLQRLLRAALPEHMVPSSLVLLPELPLTPNGKVDRRALPDPDDASFDQRSQEPPRTEAERRLAGIWEAILGPRRFGVHDNFFQIGGHSLLATRALARIRREFEVDVSLRSFFDHPTIAGLARVIETAPPWSGNAEERITQLVRTAYRRSPPPLG